MKSNSELLKYSSEYERMSNNFNKVYSAEDAKRHPILQDYDLEDYLFHPLMAPADIEHYAFFSQSQELGEKEVPKQLIVGTTHPSYQGMT